MLLGTQSIFIVRPLCLDGLLSLSLCDAEGFVVVAALGPGLGLQAGGLDVGRDYICGQLVCLALGPRHILHLRERGLRDSLALLGSGCEWAGSEFAHGFCWMCFFNEIIPELHSYEIIFHSGHEAGFVLKH